MGVHKASSSTSRTQTRNQAAGLGCPPIKQMQGDARSLAAAHRGGGDGGEGHVGDARTEGELEAGGGGVAREHGREEFGAERAEDAAVAGLGSTASALAMRGGAGGMGKNCNSCWR